MNYLQWNNATINHFFNEKNEEKEVTLYFSERIITEIGETLFEKPEDGYLEDFFRALKIGVNGISNNDYIQRIIDLDERFTTGTRAIEGIALNYPPYLTYLLSFILPFTSGEIEAEFSMSNFHGIAKKYFEEKQLTGDYNKYIKLRLKNVDYIWSKINEWLIEKNNFCLGYLEEINDPIPNRKYVSKYEYHILFRKEQEERLSKVFDNCNILPNDAITEDQIRNLLIENSDFLKLSSNTKEKIKQNDYIGDKLVKRAYNFYKSWTGTTHLVEGQRGYSRKKLVLCLDFNLLSQKLKIKYFRAFSKDTLPENSILQRTDGTQIENFHQNRELYSIPLLDCFIDLETDIELKDEVNRVKYSWKAKDFYIFKRIPQLDWIEIPKVEFNAGKALIICTNDFYINKLEDWFEAITGTKSLFKDNTKTFLSDGWMALIVENITCFPHPDLPELIVSQDEKPKINFDKEFYSSGVIFKDKLPNVWIENFENTDPIIAKYEDGTEIVLIQNFNKEKDENGNEVSYPVNSHYFTSEHLAKITQQFKLQCGNVETQRFLKISDFKKIDNNLIEELLPKRNSIGQIVNTEGDYSKGLEHFFTEEKICLLKPYQNLLDNQSGIFKNTINAQSYTKGNSYNVNHPGNILINYISTKGRLAKTEYEWAIVKLLESTDNNEDIKQRANNLMFQLQDVGYIDYNANDSSLCVNKSQFVIIPSNEGTTVMLTGARDNNFISTMIEYAEENQIVIDIQNEDDELFPQFLFFRFKECSHKTVEKFAGSFNLVFKKSGLYTQFALASHFNDISKWENYIKPVENLIEDFEGGYIFDIEKLSFIRKPDIFNKQLAFTKFTEISGYKTICRLWYKNISYEISNQQFGIYLYLFLFREMREESYNKKRGTEGWINCGKEIEDKKNANMLTNILLYDKNRKYLAVPLYCRLPRFFSQSVSLLSGRKADVKYIKSEKIRYNGKYLIYRNVPSLFVNNIFVNLKQKLTYTKIL